MAKKKAAVKAKGGKKKGKVPNFTAGCIKPHKK